MKTNLSRPVVKLILMAQGDLNWLDIELVAGTIYWMTSPSEELHLRKLEKPKSVKESKRKCSMLFAAACLL